MDAFDFETVQRQINGALRDSLRQIESNPDKFQRFADRFDRTAEAGFYSGEGAPRAEGETPTWSPNPAYIESLEEMWESALRVLKNHGLEPDSPIREQFDSSREYKDSPASHRRVFIGQLVSRISGKPVTLYVLTVPHSHDRFEYVVPPHIHLSKSLPDS